MLRKYPLTMLFIIATICVDVVLVAATSDRHELIFPHSGWQFYVWNFLIPAQISALGLWSVFSKAHRLTKAAVLTLGGAAITFLHLAAYNSAYLFNEGTMFNLFHISIVIVGSLSLKLLGVGRTGIRTKKTFQFSIMEVFGWSMIVALWAFALRVASSQPLPDFDYISGTWMAAATIPPLLVVPVLFSNLTTTPRLIGLGSIYLGALLIYLFTDLWFARQNRLDDQIVHWSFGMAVTQISYISAWWAVMRMDEAMQERQAIIDASREKLKVFEP
jgi:hypothetical protein